MRNNAWTLCLGSCGSNLGGLAALRYSHCSLTGTSTKTHANGVGRAKEPKHEFSLTWL